MAGVAVGVGVAVAVAAGVRVAVGVNVGVKVAVGVVVAVGVMVAVGVSVAVIVGVKVAVEVGVRVLVGVIVLPGVAVRVSVGVGVSNSQGSSALALTTTAISNPPLTSMIAANPAMSLFISLTLSLIRTRIAGFADSPSVRNYPAAPLTPQSWGETMLLPPVLGGRGGHTHEVKDGVVLAGAARP